MELIKEKELFPKVQTGEALHAYVDRRMADLEKIIENQNRRTNWLLKRLSSGDWRIIEVGNNLEFQRWDGAAWVKKGAVTI